MEEEELVVVVPLLPRPLVTAKLHPLLPLDTTSSSNKAWEHLPPCLRTQEVCSPLISALIKVYGWYTLLRGISPAATAAESAASCSQANTASHHPK